MHRQTIRTFIEVRDGVVKVLHTDPVLRPQARGGDKCAAGIDQQEEIPTDRPEGVDAGQDGHPREKSGVHGQEAQHYPAGIRQAAEGRAL